MKKIFFFILMVIGTFHLQAQTPTYKYTSIGTQLDAISSGIFNNTPLPKKWQCLYNPSDLKNPPKGLITQIYFRSDSMSFISSFFDPNRPSKIPKLKVRMGLTTKDSFDKYVNINQIQCMTVEEEGLWQTVISSNLYTITDTLLPYKWFMLPLQVPFYYTHTKNLLVEISVDSSTVMDTIYTGVTIFNGPIIMTAGTFGNHQLFYYTPLSVSGHRDSTKGSCNGNFRYDFGFDLDTTVNSIDDIPKQPLRVYPNPASSHISLTYSGSNTAYQISNITGQVVQAGNVKHHEIDISRLPRGMYLLRMGYEVVRFFKEDE
jgi:hypothetical protein